MSQDILDLRRKTRIRFVSGSVLGGLSTLTMVYAIYGMRAGLVALASPGTTRKPAEIASEMLQSGTIGYIAAAASGAALWMMITAYRTDRRTF